MDKGDRGTQVIRTLYGNHCYGPWPHVGPPSCMEIQACQDSQVIGWSGTDAHNHNQQSQASKTRSEPKRSQRSDLQQKQKKILRQTKSDDTKEMC